MTSFRPCAVIPTRNHVHALGGILSELTTRDLSVIVIDDGSDTRIAAEIAEVCNAYDLVERHRHTFSGGKGFAVVCGLARAKELGFTHAIQIDADGQHDMSAIELLLEIGRTNPEAIVAGSPRYDSSIPRLRRLWRPLTNFWARINTLSSVIEDAMCGFRLYPVCSTLSVVRTSVRSRGMDFDIEVLVKAHWAGIPIRNAPVQVTYPAGNHSNFDVYRDNVKLSLTHARLFFGMLARFPRLLINRPAVRKPAKSERNWTDAHERGAYWGLLLLGLAYRAFGRTVCLAAMFPVVTYFFLAAREQRRCSMEYLLLAWHAGYLPKKPTAITAFRHFLNFGASTLDKLVAWSGNVPITNLDADSIAAMDEVAASPRGAFVITAHVGNPEVVRAVATLSKRAVVNVLMYTRNAQMFNRLIQKFAPDANVRVVDASNIGPETAIVLADMVSRGEWVVVAGDRIPPGASQRAVTATFLGAEAEFPQGPFILGSILKCPTYLMFCLRHRNSYHVHFSRFADPITLVRGNRQVQLSRYVSSFARELETCLGQAPLQWFNFYRFWNTGLQIPRPSAAEQ